MGLNANPIPILQVRHWNYCNVDDFSPIPHPFCYTIFHHHFHRYEVLDGQQRTISICRYVAGDYSIDHQAFGNLTEEEREDILKYELVIYICEGTEREKLDWLEDYMAAHQHDADCDDLWTYFEAVAAWVGETFPNTRVKLMKGLPWGIYYNRFGHVPRDAAALEARIAQLLRDDEDVGDITNQRGIYEYLLDGDERHLSIRAFSPKMARTAYERQKGVCPICGKHFAIEDMQADHIVPWSKGGRTTADNCQMLCKADNLRKSAT